MTGQLARADFLVLAMARQISDGATVATGVLSWLPMLAIALARATHAPRLGYLNCAGAINPCFGVLPSSSTDVRLLRDNPYCLRLTDLWDFASLGRIDVMFFGFAQLDHRGNTNLSWLDGSKGSGRKLPGVAGAFALRQLVKHPVLFSARHSRSTLVRRVETVTTVPGGNPVSLVTDLGVFRLTRGRLDVVSLHPSVELEELDRKTGFPVRHSRRPRTTPLPSGREWRALEGLDPEKIRYRYGNR